METSNGEPPIVEGGVGKSTETAETELQKRLERADVRVDALVEVKMRQFEGKPRLQAAFFANLFKTLADNPELKVTDLLAIFESATEALIPKPTRVRRIRRSGSKI